MDKNKKANHKAKYKVWEEEILKPSLERFPERQSEFVTTSGIPIPRFLFDYNVEKLSFPGDFPFTRGVQPTMYRAKFWTMRQYAGFGTPEETNERFKYLLEHGQTGLSIAFDLPTQMGYDSDQSVALSEVGKVGVAVDTLEDIIEVFNGIPLDKVSVSFTINATAPIILAMFIAAARRQGVPPEKLRGTIQNDILKEYAARGTYIFPPEPSMRITTDVIEFCAKKLTQLNPISVSGYHIREAGATAVQEISFTLCSGIEYIKRVIERGLSVDDFASRVTFFFASHNNFFEEIAKFRAARRIWAGIIKNRFGALKPEAMKLKFHVQTSGVTLTSQEPENNILRVGYQALAAALGGAQSIHTNSFDEALALPAESSVLLALRTQQLIAYETGIADTVDPLGGAWFVEYMTDEVERRAEEYIKKVDQMGGMTKAVESGYIQREIACSAWEYQKAVEEGKMKVVGVNLFKSKREQKSQIFKISEDTLKRKLKKLEKVKKERDWDSVESSLRRLKEAAHGGENLMEPIVECVESYATLGEICSTLQMVFGRFKAPSEL